MKDHLEELEFLGESNVNLPPPWALFRITMHASVALKEKLIENQVERPEEELKENILNEMILNNLQKINESIPKFEELPSSESKQLRINDYIKAPEAMEIVEPNVSEIDSSKNESDNRGIEDMHRGKRFKYIQTDLGKFISIQKK